MLNSVSSMVVTHSLRVWAVVLALAVLWALTRNLPLLGTSGESEQIDRTAWSPITWGLGVIVLALTGALVTYTLWRPEFAGRDGFTFTTATLLGENYPPPVWVPDGRFFPLGHQEFNLVRYVTVSAVGYHLVLVSQLVVVLWAANRLMRSIPATGRMVVLATLLVSPGVSTVFTHLVYPERNVVFCLAIFLLMVQQWDRAPSRLLLAGILLTAQFALYFKETSFLLLGGFAVTRLAIKSNDIRDVFRLGKREVEWGLLALSAIWIATFMLFLLQARNASYATRFALSFTDIITGYILGNPLLVVFFAIVTWRVSCFMLRRGSLDLVWDPLGVGAAAFAVSYVVLKLYQPYYMAAAEFIAVLYLGQLALRGIRHASVLRRYALSAAVVLVVATSLRTTFPNLAQRRATLDSKVAFTTWLSNRVANSSSPDMNLFLPYTSSFDLMELAAFLRYKGLPIELVVEPPRQRALRLVAPQSFPNGQCARWWRFRCYESSAPPRGSFLVVLPEDEVSVEKVAEGTTGLRQVLRTDLPGWISVVGGSVAQQRRVQVFEVP
jgi:hypothetical protein